MQSMIYTNPLGITSQFTFCGLPLRLDSYAGCSFKCTYCFARYRGGNTFGENVRPADPESIKRYFQSAFHSDTPKVGIVAQFLRHHVPVHFGGMSDPFQPAESRYRVTESILRILAAYDYPTVISTKSNLIVSEPYISLLRDIKHLVVQFSFSSTRDRIALMVEPSSSPPVTRLQTMEKLAKNGINVICRWQPYILGVSELPSEFIPRIALTGCRHVSLEHLKVPVEQHHPLWINFTRRTGRNLYEDYRRLGAFLDGREFILPANIKLPIVLETATIARSQGLTFGAADNEFQYISDTACCCGVDQFSGFENWFKHQIGYAVRKCLGKKITYDSILHEWSPTGSIDRYLNSNSRMSRIGTSIGSVCDHIHARWNNPEAPGSPISFYGVTTTTDITSAGDRVYQWASDLNFTTSLRTQYSQLQDSERFNENLAK